MPETPTAAQLARNRYARASRRTGTAEEREEALRELTAVTIEERVAKALEGRPPLTDEQVERITARLRGDVTGDVTLPAAADKNPF